MKKFFVFFALFLFTLLSAAQPLFKVGLVTDTHVTPDKSSCRLVKASAELFRDDGVDMIINCGDIADYYYEVGYKHYRDTINEVYAGKKKPAEIFVYANHDRLNRTKEDMFKVFLDVKKHLQIPNDPYDEINFKGYNFVVVPQYMDFKRFDAMIAKACKASPGKPVFVIDHVTPYGTSIPNNGEIRRRRILNKYPQVVHISGHYHSTLSNEQLIWQGEFTALNCGCLQRWTGNLVGNSPPMFPTDMVMIMDVYKDKLVFRRFFSTTKKEYKPDNRWCVPLPFDPKTAPYTEARRYAASRAPKFAASAKVVASVTPKEVKLRFSRANHRDGIFYYKVEAQRQLDGKWVTFARRDARGQFMLAPEKRKKNLSHSLSASFFEAGKTYRIQVTPVHFFGKAGAPIATEFTVKSVPGRTVFYENRNPMETLICQSNRGKPFKKDKDGYFLVTDNHFWLRLPDDIWKKLPQKASFNFVIDMDAKLPEDNSWSLTLRNRTNRMNARLPLRIVPGSPGEFRYIILGYKKNAKHHYDLLVRGALSSIPAKVKFNYIRIEKR